MEITPYVQVTILADTQRNAIIIKSNQMFILRTGEKTNKHMHAFTGNLHWNSSTNEQHSHDILVTCYTILY